MVSCNYLPAVCVIINFNCPSHFLLQNCPVEKSASTKVKFAIENQLPEDIEITDINLQHGMAVVTLSRDITGTNNNYECYNGSQMLNSLLI